MGLKIELCDRESRSDLYDMMDDLIGKYHPHLADATILLGFNFAWAAKPSKSKKPKPPKPKRKILGTCKRASDLERSLAVAGVDFVILLNPDYWRDCAQNQRVALLDHELCHAAAKIDRNGDRTGWAMKKHDLEEFRAVVERHGLWENDVRTFVNSANGAKPPDLFGDMLAVAEDSSITIMKDSSDEASQG